MPDLKNKKKKPIQTTSPPKKTKSSPKLILSEKTRKQVNALLNDE